MKKASDRELDKSLYKERHHIIPKCLGGDNKKCNLVNLLPREHYIAHLLLSKIYPNNIKLTYAFWMMSNGNLKNKRKYKVSSRAYEEIKNKISEINKKREPPFKGRRHTKEAIQKNREAKLGNKIWLGKTHLEESKKLMSIKRLGKPLPKETREKMSESKKGKKLSEETRNNMTKSKLGVKNPMFGLKGSRNPRSKPVKQYDLNRILVKEWENAKIASEKLGINYTSINNCCRKVSLTAGGFIWEYKTNLENN